jgi:hypothetical protein
MCSGVAANGHTPFTARDEIECPSLPSLRILKKSIKRWVTAFVEVPIRSQPGSISPLVSVVDSDRPFCTLNHIRRLNAFTQMQKTFAGIKPYCDVCNPIRQTTRLLTHETTRPVHIFLPTKIVATTVRKQHRYASDLFRPLMQWQFACQRSGASTREVGRLTTKKLAKDSEIGERLIRVE